MRNPNQHCLNPSGRYALPFSISIKAKRGGAKTLMITSSVSGEGKTFCSINIATVFALSGKKTVIIGVI
jgi:Mrp family chromosome partitioning ATPase